VEKWLRTTGVINTKRKLKTLSHERNHCLLWLMVNFRWEASSNSLNDQSIMQKVKAW